MNLLEKVKDMVFEEKSETPEEQAQLEEDERAKKAATTVASPPPDSRVITTPRLRAAIPMASTTSTQAVDVDARFLSALAEQVEGSCDKILVDFQGLCDSLASVIPDEATRLKAALVSVQRASPGLTANTILQAAAARLTVLEGQKKIFQTDIEEERQRAIGDRETQIGAISTRMSALRTELATLEAQMDTHKREIDARTKQIEENRANFANAYEALRNQYEQGLANLKASLGN